MGSSRGKMPETKVPMTLRDAFLEDPFFRMDTSKNMKVAEQKEERRSGRMPWLMPRKWMIPQLWDEEIFSNSRDSHLLGLQEDETKMEISLDTTGYKPDELKVQVRDGELCVEGKHEERSEAGQVMVSRQFSKRYGLPQGAKRLEVMSNLSQDGVMVITVPKEKKIEEVKTTEKIPVEHVKNVGEMNKKIFKKAREGFEESLKQMETMMSGISSNWTNPSSFDSHFNSVMNNSDNCVIRHMEDDTKMEVQLDTVGYKPDELKVEVENGVVRVEGLHQEKSESGQVMVSRQFARQYALPQVAKPEEVVSSLSKDGVLAIQVPKHPPKKLSATRAVPIALK